MNLNDLRDAIYADAVAHGLWEDLTTTVKASNRSQSAKTVYTLAECANKIIYEGFELLCERGNFEYYSEELADVIIMSLSVAGYLGIDIDAAVRRKMEINKGRPWKHGKD